MVEETTKLEAPIDVMILIHKAFQAASAKTEALAAALETGGDLDAFKKSFDFWITQLLYHATTEDKYMTAPLTDSQPARDNEAEHAELVKQGGGLIEFMEKGDSAGLEDNVKAAMLALEDKQHEELVEKAQEVEALLTQEIGKDRVVARTRRHLYRRVMGLRVLEFDHFENEEAFVCPLVTSRMDEQAQLELVKRLLIDESSENPRWIIDWVASELSAGEQKLLADLETRFSAPVA